MNMFKNFIGKFHRLLVFLLILGSISLGMLFSLPQGKAFKGGWIASLLEAVGIDGIDFQKNSATVPTTESPMVTILVSPTPSLRVTNVSPIKTPSPTPITLASSPLSPLLSPTPTIILSPTPKPSLLPSPSPTMTPMPTILFSPSPLPSTTPTPLPSLTPSPSPTIESSSFVIIINEVAWMGTEAFSNDEWIEFYNLTEWPVDLNGWTLKSLTGTNPDPVITLSGIIQPFGYFLLERTDDSTISDITADQIYTGALSDSGEILELRDPNDNLQDKTSNTEGWYAGNKTGRFSMERIDSKQSGDNAANWQTNDGVIKNGRDAENGLINGTPKAKNSNAI